MKNLISLFTALCLSSSIFAQNSDAKKPNENLQFNQKLADSLGADKLGMKNYILVILKTGKNDATITDKGKRQELFKGHFANINALADAGKLVLAGPFSTKNSQNYRGLFLFDVKTEAEAKELVEKDPTVNAGIFDYEILPWYGSASLMLVRKFHKKIQKENF